MSAIVSALATLARVSYDADGLPEPRREWMREQCVQARLEEDQLRASLATVTAERDRIQGGLNRTAEKLFAEERAHAATQGRLQSAREMRDTYHRLNLEAREELAETRKALDNAMSILSSRDEIAEAALESTRAALARSEARVKELEACVHTMKPDLGYDDEQQ